MKKNIGIVGSLLALMGSSRIIEEPPVMPATAVYEPSSGGISSKKYSRNRHAPHAASSQRKRRKYARQNQHCKYAKYKRY